MSRAAPRTWNGKPRPHRSAMLFNTVASAVYLLAAATVLADLFLWRP